MVGLVITLTLAGAGVTLSMVRPYYGLLVYVCFGILKPEATWHWSVPHWHYSRALAIALLAGWAVNGFGSSRFGKSAPVVAAFVAFWAWSVISSLASPQQDIAWRFVWDMAKILIPFVVGLTLIDTPDKLKQLAWVIALTLGFMAYECNVSYLTGYNRAQISGIGGLLGGSLGLMFVCGIPIALFLAFYANAWWSSVLALLLGGLMAHAAMLTFSRGAMLSAIISGAVAAWLVRRQPKYWPTFIAAGALALYFSGPELADRFSSTFADHEEQGGSAKERLDVWKDCWHATKQHPILGLGPNRWPTVAFTEYGWHRRIEAHNLWLQTASELGLPGAFLLVLFYALGVGRLLLVLRDRRAAAPPWVRCFASMSVAAIVGFTVSSTFITTEGLEAPYYIMLIGAGTLKLATNVTSPEPRPRFLLATRTSQ